MADTSTGLDGLSSYQATLTLSFTGTRAGQPSTWTKTYVIVSTKDPATEQLTIDKTGDLANLDEVVLADVGATAYEHRGTHACTAETIAADAAGRHPLEPASLLSPLTGAVVAGSDPVDGTAATHYTFDGQAIALTAPGTASGEAWVATDGGFVVKYILTMKAKADYFGDGVEGTLTTTYAVMNVNSADVPPIPPDCPSALPNLPTMADATAIDSQPGVVTYTTASNVADVAAFYTSELDKLGWKQTNEATIDKPVTNLDFIQGAASLTVSISTDADGTTVTIVASDDEGA